MAAQLHPSNVVDMNASGASGRTAIAFAAGSGAKPELVNKFEGGSDDVNGLQLIPGNDGVITISKDRSVRVWLLRDSGQYWPSVCHYMTAAATALAYHHQDRRLFVGLETGIISEFVLSEDLNRLDHIRDYHAHQSRVTGVCYSPNHKWLLSVGKDRYFQFHCVASGRRLGGYLCNAWCTALELDEEARYAFIGDYSGIITVVKLDENSGVQLVNTLKGHSGSIQTLAWEKENGWLFSGSYDCSVFVWDIGGRKGTCFELHGHRNKVTACRFISRRRILISASEDNNLVFWDLSVRREESSDWGESDLCQLCSRPFFWNFKAMYEQKQVGMRQHHCRKCGKAVCDSCSTKRSQLPRKGHEFPVRVCEECYIKITDDEKTSHARFYDIKHGISLLDMDEAKKILVTVGPDKIVKIWSMNDVL